MSGGTGHQKHALAQGKVAKPVTVPDPHSSPRQFTQVELDSSVTPDPTTEALRDIARLNDHLAPLVLAGEVDPEALRALSRIAARLREGETELSIAAQQQVGTNGYVAELEARLREYEASSDFLAEMFATALVSTGRSVESAREFVADVRRQSAALVASPCGGEDECICGEINARHCPVHNEARGEGE